jgi:hypothetical protein
MCRQTAAAVAAIVTWFREVLYHMRSIWGCEDVSLHGILGGQLSLLPLHVVLMVLGNAGWGFQAS